MLLTDVLIEFERELNARTGPDVSVLRFTPLVYYLQEEEFLHRSVRTDPLDIPAGGKLPPATSGQFRVPEPIPRKFQCGKPSFFVQPKHAMCNSPFGKPLSMQCLSSTGTQWQMPKRTNGWKTKVLCHSRAISHQIPIFPDSSIKENMAVWVVSVLLILLLLLTLCCWLCRNRVGKSSRSKSAEFYDTQLNVHAEKKPMLETKEMPRNGPTKPERKEQPPVQLLLQRWHHCWENQCIFRSPHFANASLLSRSCAKN